MPRATEAARAPRTAQVAPPLCGFRTNFRRPDFLTIDQDLLASAEIVNDTPVAYHSRRGVALVGLERRFSPELTAGIGVQGTKANVVPEANPNPTTASAPTQHYSLIGVPAYLNLDETDNLLNPTADRLSDQHGARPHRRRAGADLGIAGRRDRRCCARRVLERTASHL